MNEESKKIARPGSLIIRIKRKFYEVPDTYLFKSHDNKDIYFSGFRLSDHTTNPTWIGTVKFIEEDRFEDVPYDLLEKFLKLKYKKVIIDDEEYDIPLTMIDDCVLALRKLSKYNIKALKELKETYKDFIFK